MYPFIKLSDEVITLRPFEFGEAGVLHQAVQESLTELKPWMAWARQPYTLETAERFIAITRAQWASGDMYAFAVLDAKSGEFLGGCSLSHIHPVYHYCNLGYWVRTSKHGQGIAGRAAQLIARFAFEKAKLIRAEIVIALGNDASKRVAEKINAHHEGILLNRMMIASAVRGSCYSAHLSSGCGLRTSLGQNHKS